MENTVIVERVTKKYGSKIILNDVSLEMSQGKIYGLIGPSGAGKTTLVKLIVGMDKADKGKIKVLDKEIPNLDVLQNIGYMAQSDALYNELTGLENLTFFSSLFNLKKKERDERIRYVAKLVKLTEDLNKRVSTYSGGMKRRLSLAIAIIQNPEILILDEPTVGIDPVLRKSIWDELVELKQIEGKTIIVTTHVMDEAERCDTVAMVREGKILAIGSPQELKEAHHAKSLEEVFLKIGGDHQ